MLDPNSDVRESESETVESPNSSTWKKSHPSAALASSEPARPRVMSPYSKYLPLAANTLELTGNSASGAIPDRYAALAGEAGGRYGGFWLIIRCWNV
jgi:hypothetical protein